MGSLEERVEELERRVDQLLLALTVTRAALSTLPAASVGIDERAVHGQEHVDLIGVERGVGDDRCLDVRGRDEFGRDEDRAER